MTPSPLFCNSFYSPTSTTNLLDVVYNDVMRIGVFSALSPGKPMDFSTEKNVEQTVLVKPALWIIAPNHQ
jgi:hypothetical protein